MVRGLTPSARFDVVAIVRGLVGRTPSSGRARFSSDTQGSRPGLGLRSANTAELRYPRCAQENRTGPGAHASGKVSSRKVTMSSFGRV